MNIVQVDPGTWTEKFSEHAHLICFGKHKNKNLDRIDYALLAVEDSPIGYMTCRELDKDTVYWQFGGAFPGTKDTIKSFRAYQAFRDWHSTRYKRVVTYIENNNFVMLKMAMKIGFLVTGIRNFKTNILLEHTLEF